MKRAKEKMTLSQDNLYVAAKDGTLPSPEDAGSVTQIMLRTDIYNMTAGAAIYDGIKVKLEGKK